MSATYDESSYSLRGGQWYKGCGCGQRPTDLVRLPDGTQPVYVQRPGPRVGPATGIEYMFRPNTIALDVDVRDAEVWLSNGTAIPPINGLKGRLSQPVKE